MPSWSLRVLCGLLAAQVAYGFRYVVDNSTITECGQVAFEWDGGEPPFIITVFPEFSVPFNTTIDDKATTQYNLSLPIGAKTNLVFMMSDKTGFGSGGISPMFTVGDKKNGASCSLSKPSPDFTFSVEDNNPNGWTQCAQEKFSADGAQGVVTFLGLIPSGSFWSWTETTPSSSVVLAAEAGATIMWSVWDSAGRSGGASKFKPVVEGDKSCLGDAPFTTTSWAWTLPGHTETSRPSATSASSRPSGSHAGTGLSPGVIAGIVVGVVVLALIIQAILLWFCCRRKMEAFFAKRRMKEKFGTKPGDVDLGLGYEEPFHETLLGGHNRDARYSNVDDAAGNITPFTPFAGSSSASPRPSREAWPPNPMRMPEPTLQGQDMRYLSSSSAAGPVGQGYPSSSYHSEQSTTYPSTYASSSLPARGSSRYQGSSSQGLSPFEDGSMAPAGSGAGVGAVAGLTSKQERERERDRQFESQNQNQSQAGSQDGTGTGDSVFDAKLPSAEAPAGGFRQHQDAGALPDPSPAAQPEVEDLPPTYDPNWRG